MKILEVKKYPDKILCQRSCAIKVVKEKEVELFDDMLCTMCHLSGIGLAAPQVGISQRIIVVDIGAGPIKLANPEVIEIQGKAKMEEGCLSVPDTLVSIARSEELIVRGLNEKGKIVEIKAKGLLARALLHEIDHINGKLIVDYMNFLRKLKYNLRKKNKT